MFRFGYAVMVGSISACLLVACGDKNNPMGNVPNPSACKTTTVSYKDTIAPLLTANCTGCHTGSTGYMGIGLDTYDGVKANANAALAAMQPGGTMPPSGSIPTSDLKNFQDWVDGCTPNN